MPYLVGYITPQDYNSAAGDGATECSAAIQSAITAAAAGSGGRTLFFPGGTYLISSSLVLSSLVTYLGSEEDATIIKATNGSNLTCLAATTGWLNNTNTSAANPLQMRHLIWDGNKANQTSGAGHGVVLQSFYTNVEYCTFQNTRGDGLRWDVNTANGGNTLTNTCVENRVMRCQLRANGGDGFHVNDSTNNKITDGWFIDNVVDTPSGNAINIQAGAGWVVQGSHVYNVGFSGIRVDRMFQTRIVGNYIESCGASSTSGTYALIDGLNGQVNDGGQGSTIANNVGYFQGPAGNAGSTIVGIGVQAATAATATVSVVGNQLFQTGGTGTTAIQLQNQASTSSITAYVSDNTLVGWTTNLNQVVNGGTISANGTNGPQIAVPAFKAQPTATGNVAYTVNVNGSDGFDRMRILGDGSYQLGPGSATRDVQFARSAAGTLAVTSPTSGVASTTVTGANSGGKLLAVTNTTSSPTNSNILVTANAAGDASYGVAVNGDTNNRWFADSNGLMQWGPGNAAVDTVAGRAGGGVWYTSKNLLVGASSPLGDNGVGELQLHNYTTAPTSAPSNGVVVFAQSAAAIPLMAYDPGGNKRSVVDAIAIATADQTFTTTSQVASTYLTIALETSATYLMETGVIFSNATSGNTVFSWTGPTGATMKWNDTTTAGDYQSTIGGTNTYSFSASTRLAFFKGKLVVSTTGGNLTLTVSNSVGGTSTSTVLTDSWLRLTRVK